MLTVFLVMLVRMLVHLPVCPPFVSADNIHVQQLLFRFAVISVVIFLSCLFFVEFQMTNFLKVKKLTDKTCNFQSQILDKHFVCYYDLYIICKGSYLIHLCNANTFKTNQMILLCNLCTTIRFQAVFISCRYPQSPPTIFVPHHIQF